MNQEPRRPRRGSFLADPVALVDDLIALSADPRRTRRFLIALALAVTLVAVLLALAHLPAADETRERIDTLTYLNIERRTPPPTPAPTPTPTAPPTQQATLPPVRTVTPAPIVQRAAPTSAKPRGGAKEAPHAKTPPKPRAERVATVTTNGMTGSAPAPGTGEGDGAGSGVGAGSGSGAGNGTGGTGTGVNADKPCGYVDFIPTKAPRYQNNTAYEKIRATVAFSDGHKQSAEFPYDWAYPNGEETDPWSKTNLAKPDFRVVAQVPPAGTDTSHYPDLIQYILAHTTPDGRTLLEECPAPRP